MSRKYLVTGANGQLAQEFVREFDDSREQFTALDKKALDISDEAAVDKALSESKPDIVLNCAAYNYVDQAEKEMDLALKVNADGVKNLAVGCREKNILLVHYSTDIVFDGEKHDFYKEDDIPGPVNNYGKSKLKGEENLRAVLDDYLMLRVSWVMGKGKSSFTYKLDRLAEKHDVLRMTTDYVSIPTYTKDIVTYTLLALEKGLRGTYHLTNSGYTSKYEQAKYYLEKIGNPKLIFPVTSKYFPKDVKRPHFTALSNRKISKELKIEIPHWQNALDRLIQSLKEDCYVTNN